MKNRILIATLLLLLFLACKDENKKDLNNATSIQDEVIKATTKVTQKNLQNKTPFNRQELEDTFPYTINNLDRDQLQVNEDMYQATGTFGDGAIKLTITDAAGFGQQVITMFYALYDTVQPNSEYTTYENKIRDNLKTTAVYHKNTAESSIIFVYLDRFYIELFGRKMTPDELWKRFDIERLSSLDIVNEYDERNH